jgi:hypothetical protein
MAVKSGTKLNKSVALATAICGAILIGSSFVLNRDGIMMPKASATVDVPQSENEETSYLEFASQALKQSDNSSNVNATTQLPEAAKGPAITAKGYLVQQIRGVFTG